MCFNSEIFHAFFSFLKFSLAFEEDTKCRLPYRQRKQRKSGFVALEAQRSFDYQTAGGRWILFQAYYLCVTV